MTVLPNVALSLGTTMSPSGGGRDLWIGNLSIGAGRTQRGGKKPRCARSDEHA